MIIILFVAVVFDGVSRFTPQWLKGKPASYYRQTFKDQQVNLDNSEYVEWTFDNATFHL
jgi:hypothetical protein